MHAEGKPAGDALAMRALIEQYTEDFGLIGRHYDIPHSTEDLGAKRQFLLDQREALTVLGFPATDRQARIDYLLLRNELDHQLQAVARKEKQTAELAELLPFAPSIVQLEHARRKVETLDPREAASSLAQLRREAESTRQRLQAALEAKDERAREPVAKTLAARALRAVGDLRQTLKRWSEFYSTYDPEFAWWATKPHQAADTALGECAGFLKEELLGIQEGDEDPPVIGDPVGREALVSDLAHAMIPYTPDELIAIGEGALAECEAEMAGAARELGCGDDWRSALEQVKGDFVPPGQQPRLVQELALEAIEFIEEHDLVTIPPLARRLWKIEMMTPERQKENPFFTGGETIHVSYPTSTMGHDQKLMTLRGNNRHFARATVHHELIPGHHLQGYASRRYRPYRRMFSTPFYTEGWPLHWEMLLWDLGFAASPQNRIGMLFWRMHRCARVIFSLKFHLGEMTPEECVDLLVRRVGLEHANALAEVRRSFEGAYSPLYQCAYMVGGLQMRALHSELVGSGHMKNREFHDAVLRENAIPLELVRASLAGQTLTEDFRPSWRFAEGH
ncbi:MAG: DUF885 family protein [Armatimonadota bacterium]